MLAFWESLDPDEQRAVDEAALAEAAPPDSGPLPPAVDRHFRANARHAYLRKRLEAQDCDTGS